MSKGGFWWENIGSVAELSDTRRARKMRGLKNRFRRLPHSIRHTLLRPAFWIGMTIGFPLEHLIWEKVWPFHLLTRWLGL